MALLNSSAAADTHDQNRQLGQEARTVEESREDVARVNGQPGDLRVATGQFVGVQQLCQLGLAVAGPFVEEAEVGLVGFEGCEVDSLGGSLLVGDGSHVDDADVCFG